MQVSIPERIFGDCHYLCPLEMHKWVDEYKLRISYCGSNSSGTGYDKNGESNREWSYMVYNIKEEDASIFKIRFPDCKVYLSEQIA